MNAEIGYADVNNVALRYALRQTAGDETPPRPRLVLVHEMGGCLENWDEAADLLSMGWDVLTYDTRGAGLSEKILGGVTIDDLAGDLLALLDFLEWYDDLCVAGTAIGAATAIRAIRRAPDRFRAFAGLSPALNVAPEKRAATFAAADRLVELGVRSATDSRWDHVWPPSLRDNLARAEAVRCRKLGNDPHSFAALYRMVADMDVVADLPHLFCPTLYLAGRFDGTRTPEMVSKIAKATASADFRVIESGHVMQAISPEIVASHLDAFFTCHR